jgi:hypothetical protein
MAFTAAKGRETQIRGMRLRKKKEKMSLKACWDVPSCMCGVGNRHI